MSKEAMKLALEALEEINKLSIGANAVCLPAEIDTAMDALREALAEQPAQQEAKIVRWNCPCGNKYTFHGFTEAPPQRKPLTKTKVGNYLRRHAHGEVGMYRNGFKDGVRYAEAAHEIKEKNT